MIPGDPSIRPSQILLADPKGFVPNGKMVFAGLKKPDDVAAVIDYLKTLK